MNDTPAAVPSSSAPASRRDFLVHGGLFAAGLAALAPVANAATAGAVNDPRKAAADLLYGVPLAENGDYLLPPLAYAYDALEPHFDKQTMELHHSRHTEAYRVGLNRAYAALAEARAKNDFAMVQYWSNQLSFNGGGYHLHMVFFSHLAAAGTTTPSDWLKAEIARHFGTWEGFQAHFTAACLRVEGSGWGLLVFQPVGQRLTILQAEKQQNLTQWGVVPILTLDMWEHAYYLRYQNRRADFIAAFWNVVNWNQVEARLRAAHTLFA